MADIIKFEKPKPPEPPVYKWLGHKCANYTYWLRDDGVVVCTNCNEEIALWLPK